MIHSNYGPISYRFRRKRRFRSKIANSFHPVNLTSRWEGSLSWKIVWRLWINTMQSQLVQRTGCFLHVCDRYTAITCNRSYAGFYSHVGHCCTVQITYRCITSGLGHFAWSREIASRDGQRSDPVDLANSLFKDGIQAWQPMLMLKLGAREAVQCIVYSLYPI